MKSDPPGETRIPALDGLRGIAILIVLLGHCLWQEKRFYGGVGDFVFGLAGSSWCGVDLFFVLSGFLITGILYDAKASRNFFSSFYMRRVLRIFPLYYGVLLAAIILVPAFARHDSAGTDFTAHHEWLWLFGANLKIGLDQYWHFHTPWVGLGHFWSLAVEEQFYFVWPLIVFALGRCWLMGVCVAAIGAALGSRAWMLAGGAEDVALFVLPWCRMDSLAMGALLALAVRGPAGIGSLVKPAWGVLVATGTLLLLLVYAQGGLLNEHQDTTLTVGFTLLAGFFGAMLIISVAAREGSLLGRFFSSEVLRFFGKYSYALYIFQAIPRSFYHTLFPIEPMSRFFGSYRVALGVYSLLVLGTMVLLAMLSWHCYEKHFLKMRRFFPYLKNGNSPQLSGIAPHSTPQVQT